MSQINSKKLPKGFSYPITKKEIRSWIKTADTNTEFVTFSFVGTGKNYFSKAHASSYYFPVSVTALPDEKGWQFAVEISGLKHERYEERREEISTLLLAHITNWVACKLALSVTAPKKPSRASLNFNLTREEIVEIKEKAIFHPKGTAVGFFSSF